MAHLLRTTVVIALTLLQALVATADVSLRPLPSSPGWEGLQFLGTDSQHRVYVLNAAEFEVHRLEPGGLGDPLALEGVESLGDFQVLSAAMGDGPGDWLIRAGAYQVRWFRGRKEKPLPESPWLVQAVLVADGTPVAAVAPLHNAYLASDEDRSPLLAQVSGQEWRSLFEDDGEESLAGLEPEERADAYRRHRWRITLHLAADPTGRVWMADQHAFRLRELTESGRLRTELTLGADPEMVISERSSEEIEAFYEAAEATGKRVSRNLPGLSEKPEISILGMTAGWDGRVYVVAPGDDEELDIYRWDPLRLALEVVAVGGGEVSTSAPLELAAGGHGLYIVERAGDLGRWWVSWEELESAAWAAPEGETVYLDGRPLAEVAPAPEEGEERGADASEGR